MKNTSHNAGFSLIEMAIVITIGAILAIGLISLANVSHERSKVERTHLRLDAIEEALLAYATSSNSLPCPARYNSSLNSATYGISADCSLASPPANTGMSNDGTGNEEVWQGAVPVRSLNLDDRFMIDGWQNRISYAVIKSAATTDLTQYSTTDADGVITIQDSNDNQITLANSDVVIGYILISHGKDGAGSYSRVVTAANTTPTTACVSGTQDEENCNGDASFRDMRINDSSTNSNYYFDIVRWKPLYFLEALEVNP